MRVWGINLGKEAGAYMDIKSIVKELCAYDDEQEWFEFKENSLKYNDCSGIKI